MVASDQFLQLGLGLSNETYFVFALVAAVLIRESTKDVLQTQKHKASDLRVFFRFIAEGELEVRY